MLLDQICNATEEYAKKTSKTAKKARGQFFTPQKTAAFMASHFNSYKQNLRILDPGAGSGILSAAIIEQIVNSNITTSIHIDLYENDKQILPLLKENIERMKSFCSTKNIILYTRIIEKNFIEINQKKWKQPDLVGEYDLVICNPPYKKINKGSVESLAMAEIVYGQPNIYYLFMAMSIALLKNDGDFIFITPRSWTSGLYFKYFRKYLRSNVNILGIHLFESRKDVFKIESVLQETLIIHGRKEKNVQRHLICVSTSNGSNDFENIKKKEIDENLVLQNYNGY